MVNPMAHTRKKATKQDPAPLPITMQHKWQMGYHNVKQTKNAKDAFQMQRPFRTQNSATISPVEALVPNVQSS
jgi:hypothetical protein